MDLDWNLLPPEIIQMISEKLVSIADFVHFRAVCNTWRSVSYPRPKHLPPQLPWLVLPCAPHENLSMYDLSQLKTHVLDLPEIKGKRICGSSNGWLILEDQDVYSDLEAYLFNPVTRDQISLPSFYADPNLFINLYGDSKDHVLDPIEYRIKKAILSSNPSIDPDCLLMAIFAGSWDVAFCRIGDKCWTVISELGEDESEDDAVDIGYHNGLFYVLNDNGHVRICDIHNPSCKVIIPEQAFDYVCPVEGGCDEHGLTIFCFSFNYSIPLKFSPVDIHSIMAWSDQENWLDMEGEHLNKNIFFLEFGRRFHCKSLPVADIKLEEWQGNRMCYISYQFERIDGVYRSSCSIKLFGLGNGSERTLAGPLHLYHSRKYDHTFSRPNFFWLTPTLC